MLLSVIFHSLCSPLHGSSEDEDEPVLTEEVILQIKNNDSDLTFLRVDFDEKGLLQTSIDWAELGPLIGAHTHLEQLHIDASIGISGTNWDNLEASRQFFKDIASNESIEHLVLMGPRTADMFSASCLEHNSNLQCLELRDSHVGSDGFVALGQLIEHPGCKLHELHLAGGDFRSDSSVSILRDALANNTSVKKLRLSFYTANHASIKWTCCNSSIEELTLEDPYAMDDEELSELGNVLKDNATLKSLKLGFGDDATHNGWMTFCLNFRNNDTLQELDISGNNLNNQSLTTLMTILSNNSTLKTLRLENIRHVTREGWLTIATLYLPSPTCALENLYLGQNTFDATTFRELSRANRRTVKKLCLTLPSSDRSLNTPRCGWNPFVNMLTQILHNKNSIDKTFNSNHNLESICYPHEEARLERVMEDCPLIGKNLPTYLMQNRANCDKFAVARRKIIESHYYNIGYNVMNQATTRDRGYRSLIETMVDSTNDMDTPELLPHFMTWVGRDDDGLPIMYDLIKKMPTLFEPISKAESSPPKKRSKC